MLRMTYQYIFDSRRNFTLQYFSTWHKKFDEFMYVYNRLFSRFCIYVRYANKNSDRIDNVLLLRK